jgi:imidazolonepropionase-like amidohydrolase
MKSMIQPAIACVCVAAAVAAAGCSTNPPVANAPGTTVLYEGARLIPGDGGAAVEDSAFLVENDTIARIGRKGEVTAPEGTSRVDLSGKTVMPTLINAHGHPGFQRGLTYAAENFTRENILDDLKRAEYFGVAAIQSQGIERGDVMYQIRAEQEAGTLGGALLRIAGRGIGAPNAGPGNAAYAGIAYEVTTPEEGVRSVQEVAGKGVNAVKIWVDDRNGRAPRMPAPVFTAIIAEAHRHKLRVTAHVFYHTDAVDLVAAGVDGLAHLVRDKEMDDALVASIVQRNVYPMGNLSSGQRGTYESLPPWLEESDPMMKLLRESVPVEVLQRMIDSFANRDPKMVAAARERYAILTRSLARLNAAGARLTLGADTGVQDHLFGFATHRELEEMVRAGMTPAQGIVAATSRPAEYIGLQNLGTLAPGKLASFLVLDANPLEDITNTRRIAQVYLKGRALDRAGMRARLTSVTATRAN